jgi:predicted RNase H-like nuclease (RuvC/YqgF family)
MTDITLFNDSASRMSVMALGKAIEWNPKTTLIVSEKESEILLKYGHIKKYDEISSDGGEKVRNLEEENKILKARIEVLEAELLTVESQSKEGLDREALKAKAKDLGIEFAKNIKTEELAKLIEGK